MRCTRGFVLCSLAALLTGCTPVFNKADRSGTPPTEAAAKGAGASAATSPSDVALQDTPADAIVVGVVDGDTIDVDIGGNRERVRLIGIDTPETKKPNTPVQCWGPEATARTAELLQPGAAVHLLRDAELRDDYGRLLAYVFRPPDDLFVNLSLAAEGFAKPLKIAPNTLFAADFAAAAGTARRSGLGLWRHCPNAGSG